MTSAGDSSRREFLTGRAAQRALRQYGGRLADEILGPEEPRTPPQGQDTVRLETRAMACPWSVILNPGPPRQVMIASDALDVVHLVEQQLTVYRDDSDIAKVNQAAFEAPQPVPESLIPFFKQCQELWQQTDGAFDPATGALIQLWKTARQQSRIPDSSEVSQALDRCGWQHVSWDPEHACVTFDTAGVLLDFGAIGKGYAIDLAAAHLRDEDQESFLIHGGFSSLMAHGQHASLDGWPVGIRNPLFTKQRYATVLLKDQAMSTSGSNIQYFRYQGRRYGHILNPQTGWPAEGLLSVTILAPTAAEADALSTAFYVMGLDKALRYCDDRLDIGAILIPVPTGGRTLEPIVRNVPEERLFFEQLDDAPGNRNMP